jgi:hypothetical protein
VSEQIFVSYSRKDEETVRGLVERLRDDGFDLWFDRDNLRGGQYWDEVIAHEIDTAKAVVVCLSSNWVSDSGYAWKELRIIIEAARLHPLDAPWIVPVRLDSGVRSPGPLEKIQHVDLHSPDGYHDLISALHDIVEHPSGRGPAASTTARVTPSAFEEWFIDAIERGAVVHHDPWQSATSEEELAFKKLLRGRVAEGFDAIQASEYQRVANLWRPLLDNEYFDTTHESWRDRPFFQANILNGKCQLFIALVQLNQYQVGEFGQQAFKILEEILDQPPFSMKGGSSTRLHTGDARVQNLNYRDTLQFAVDWFGGWSPRVFQVMYEIPEETSEWVATRVRNRIGEIDFLLRQFPD